MYSDFYNTTTVTSNPVDGTWLIISAVLAIVGGIAAYVLFVSRKKEKEYNGFVAWLHDFLNFKKYFVEVILKVTYLITAIFITLGSFSFIGKSVASFFFMLIVGNIITRVCYEMILMLLTVVNNTTEINKKLSSSNELPKTQSKTKKKSETVEED